MSCQECLDHEWLKPTDRKTVSNQIQSFLSNGYLTANDSNFEENDSDKENQNANNKAPSSSSPPSVRETRNLHFEDVNGNCNGESHKWPSPTVHQVEQLTAQETVADSTLPTETVASLAQEPQLCSPSIVVHNANHNEDNIDDNLVNSTNSTPSTPTMRSPKTMTSTPNARNFLLSVERSRSRSLSLERKSFSSSSTSSPAANGTNGTTTTTNEESVEHRVVVQLENLSLRKHSYVLSEEIGDERVAIVY